MLPPAHATVTVNGVPLHADASGGLWWPERRLLAVADLHLEKASAYAARGGAFLPPYDTRATIDALERLIRRHRPTTVIALGDSFHDRGARLRLAEADTARLRRVTDGIDWIWIAGNHDPEPPLDLGGRMAAEVTVGALTFRHAPAAESAAGEVCGHLHPKASVAVRARLVTARCFVTDGRRMVLPAFGAFTGGLDVHDEAFRAVFRRGFRVLLAGADRLHMFPASRLVRRAVPAEV